VIGVGGITNARDAMEFLIVGARAVQIGTAHFINPRAAVDIVEGMADYFVEHDIRDVNEFIGTLHEGR